MSILYSCLTAGAGGFVAQLGTIAAVGAAFNGNISLD
ncbi:MAG: hypothetical protein CM1200mP11_2340 [Nitrosopumilaceae archaeon]|nr:MAG: hypothetical protein CM1200mP11_2340 [Nitrosopumilaceae archaeon]